MSHPSFSITPTRSLTTSCRRGQSLRIASTCPRPSCRTLHECRLEPKHCQHGGSVRSGGRGQGGPLTSGLSGRKRREQQPCHCVDERVVELAPVGGWYGEGALHRPHKEHARAGSYSSGVVITDNLAPHHATEAREAIGRVEASVECPLPRSAGHELDRPDVGEDEGHPAEGPYRVRDALVKVVDSILATTSRQRTMWDGLRTTGTWGPRRDEGKTMHHMRGKWRDEYNSAECFGRRGPAQY